MLDMLSDEYKLSSNATTSTQNVLAMVSAEYRMCLPCYQTSTSRMQAAAHRKAGEEESDMLDSAHLGIATEVA